MDAGSAGVCQSRVCNCSSGGRASNLAFDGVQLRNAFQSFGSQRRGMRNLQVVELAAHVGPATAAN